MVICLSPNGQTLFELADASPRTLLVGTTRGVVKLERAGEGDAWRLAGTGIPDEQVSALVCAAGGVFAGTRRGVFRSRDEGRTWGPVLDGLANRKIFSLAVANADTGDVLYAGTDPASLFASSDDGDHWHELPAMARVPGADAWTFPAPPHVAHTKALTIDRARPTTVFAAIEQGALLKSFDGGASWTEIHGYERADDEVDRDIHRIVIAPWNPELLFLATGMGWTRSSDGGRSWTQSAPLKRVISYPDVMEASPRSDRTLFVAGARYNPRDWFSTGCAKGTIYRSHDDGENWELIDRGLALEPRANIEGLTLAAHELGVSVFIGTTDGEVYATDTFGDSWTRIAAGLAPIAKHGHASLLRVVSSVPSTLRPPFAAVAAAMNAITQRAARAIGALRTR